MNSTDTRKRLRDLLKAGPKTDTELADALDVDRNYAARLRGELVESGAVEFDSFAPRLGGRGTRPSRWRLKAVA